MYSSTHVCGTLKQRTIDTNRLSHHCEHMHVYVLVPALYTILQASSCLVGRNESDRNLTYKHDMQWLGAPLSGKTQIQAILLKKDNILKDYEANVNSNMKHPRGPQHEEIDKALLDWFRKAQSKNIPIIGASVTRKSYKNCRSSRSFR